MKKYCTVAHCEHYTIGFTYYFTLITHYILGETNSKNRIMGTGEIFATLFLKCMY